MSLYDLIIRNGTLVTSGVVERGDIAVADGRIVALAPELEGTSAEVIDASGLHVLAGTIDVHVHFNEPGRTDWEGWASGSRALAADGATACFDMPLNSSPPTLGGASFDLKLESARRSSLVDFGLWGGLTPDNLAQARGADRTDGTARHDGLSGWYHRFRADRPVAGAALVAARGHCIRGTSRCGKTIFSRRHSRRRSDCWPSTPGRPASSPVAPMYWWSSSAAYDQPAH